MYGHGSKEPADFSSRKRIRVFLKSAPMARNNNMVIESAEAVAAKILEAVETGAAEVYADTILARMGQ